MEYQNIGDEISVEGAVVQAAQALDFAGMYASQGRDTDTLLKVAESWTKVADFIVALGDHEEETEKKKSKAEVPFGIQPSKAEVEKVEEDDDHVDGQLEITVEEDEETND